MAKTKIPQSLRIFVTQRAKGYCEYCLMPANFSPSSFEMDHIIPEILKGLTDKDNLALCCRECNSKKYIYTHQIHSITQQKVRLYHPRKDNWYDHFEWDEEETLVLGKTLIGQVTIQLLELNRESNLNLRELLRLVGLHPPTEFP